VQLGSGSLKDLALAQFVGMAVGAYSSIFIATPLLVQLKSREATSQRRQARGRPSRVRRPVRQRPVVRRGMPVFADPTTTALEQARQGIDPEQQRLPPRRRPVTRDRLPKGYLTDQENVPEQPRASR
jgi:preprotein translocase subunit SecF